MIYVRVWQSFHDIIQTQVMARPRSWQRCARWRGWYLQKNCRQSYGWRLRYCELEFIKRYSLSWCSSIILVETTTASIAEIEHFVKHPQCIPWNSKIRQIVFTGEELEFIGLSSSDCVGKCSHFHLGYFSSSKNLCVTIKNSKVQTLFKSHGGQSSNDYSSARNVFQINSTFRFRG